MKLAIIAPTNLLDSCARLSSYHLVLAHEYLNNEEYRNFYNERSDFGDEIILDNGAFENGESLLASALLEIAKELKPTTVIMPDFRFDMVSTIKATQMAVDIFGNTNMRLMGVPQGNSLEEVIMCYKQLLELQEIDSIGIYEEIGEVTGLGTRIDFCNYLEVNKLIDKSIYYHALGMEENISDALALNQFKWLEGIDSAKPVVYGLHTMSVINPENFIKYPHRPNGYFELTDISKNVQNICKHNCEFLLKAFEKGETSICVQ